MRTAVILLAVLVPLAIFLLGGLWLVAHRSRRGQRASLDAAYAAFNEEVVSFLDQLDALKERHRMLPFNDLDYRAPMSGRTLSVYDALERDLDRMRAAWVQVMDVRQEVEAALEKSELDETEQAAIAARIEGASGLNGIREAYAACTRGLDELEGAHEASAPQFQTMERQNASIRAALELLGGGGFENPTLRAETEIVRDELEALKQRHAGDPLGVRGELDTLEEQTRACSDWANGLAACHGSLQVLRAETLEIREVMRAQRSEGLLLASQSANPEPFIIDAEGECGEAERCIERSEVEPARVYLERAAEGLQRARRMMEDLARAVAYCEEALAERKLVQKRLQDRLVRSEGLVDRLHAEHDASAWARVAGHPEAVRKALQRHTGQLNEIANLVSDARKDYILAADRLNHLEHQHLQLERQLDELAGCLERLDDLGRSCREDLDAWMDRLDRLETEVREHRRAMNAECEDALRGARELLQLVGEKMRETPANWPLVAEKLTGSGHELDELESLVRDLREACEEAEKALHTVRERRDQTGALLAQHREDREKPNLAFRECSEVLQGLEERADEPHGVNWTAVARECHSLQHELDQVERWAREDIRLAGQAKGSIAGAETAIRETQAFNRRGVLAATAAAEAELDRARNRLQALEYEAAISQATRARQAAHQALQEAETDARKLDQRARERRMDTIATVASVGASMLGEVIRAKARGGRGRTRWRF